MWTSPCPEVVINGLTVTNAFDLIALSVFWVSLALPRIFCFQGPSSINNNL